MTWYKTGTVNVTNGSATVTGVGTAFVANVKVGEAFRLQGGSVSYEITAIVSDTQLTITPAYLGSTQTGQAYTIVPVKGFLKGAYDALNAAIGQWNGYLSGALAGRFGDGSVGAPGVAFASDVNTGFFRPAADQIGAVTNGIRRWLLSNTAFQVDVPITGTAVQASATDTTAARLMAVGAFGLGNTQGLPAPNDDADDCVVPGFNYRFTTAGLNTPVAFPFGGTLHVFAGTTGARLQQLFIPTIAETLYIRHSLDTGSTWSAWQPVHSVKSAVGTVAQSGGTPTGAIIERGSNANGIYTRFADGTQICSHALTTSASAAVNWTFPAEFSVAPRVAALSTVSAANIVTTAGTGSGTGRSVNGYTTAGARAAFTVDILAFGRWF